MSNKSQTKTNIARSELRMLCKQLAEGYLEIKDGTRCAIVKERAVDCDWQTKNNK